MSFSTAEFLAMQARLAKKAPAPQNADTIKEVGKGGIQDKIEEWMKTQIPNIWYDIKRTDIPTSSRCGIPDVVGVYRGKSFAIEVKRKGGKVTQGQLGELRWLELAGAKTIIAYSVEEAVEFLKKL